MREKIHAVGPASETNSLAWGAREGNKAREKTGMRSRETAEVKTVKGWGGGGATVLAFWYAESVPEWHRPARKTVGMDKVMGQRIVRVISFLLLLACAGGGYYWFRVRHEGGHPTFASGPIAQ